MVGAAQATAVAVETLEPCCTLLLLLLVVSMATVLVVECGPAVVGVVEAEVDAAVRGLYFSLMCPSRSRSWSKMDALASRLFTISDGSGLS